MTLLKKITWVSATISAVVLKAIQIKKVRGSKKNKTAEIMQSNVKMQALMPRGVDE